MMSFLRSVILMQPRSSSWPMSPVCSQPSWQRRGGPGGVAPVALHHQLAAHEDLAVVGDPHLDIP